MAIIAIASSLVKKTRDPTDTGRVYTNGKSWED